VRESWPGWATSEWPYFRRYPSWETRSRQCVYQLLNRPAEL